MGIKDFIFGVVETAIDVGASLIPGGSVAKKFVKKGVKGLARATGMAKDLFAGGDGGLSGLADQFGDYKKGADIRMGDMEKGLQGMGNRVSGLEKGLKGMGDRVGNLEGEIKGLGDRTGALEQGMGTLKEGLDSVRSDLEGVKSDIQAQGHELKQAMGEMKSELQDQIERQSELFDHKLQQQDIKFTREISRIDSEIANLSGEMRQQKEELKAEIQQKNEETKQQLRSEMQQQREQLEKAISQITQAQSQVNQAIQEHLNELDERMDQVEKKTIENARKIFTEQLERERKDQELADAIKTTNTKLNDLAQKKQDLDDNFKKHQQKFEQQAAQTQQNLDQLTDNLSQLQGQLNQKTAQTQQDFESLEQEYTRQTRALNAKIADHQDRLEDYAEEQFNLKFAQRKLDVEFRTILDETETQAHLLSEQATKLEFVARGMEEISEETHERINHLHHEIFDLNEQTEEALFTAQKAVHKIDNLTDELANERQRIKELEAQIELNQLETQQAKEEARWANERLDNLIKTDFTEQELAFAKLQKTLQLKADEAKLLAQLNLLNHSQSTLSEEEPTEREWKVGVKTGTAPTDFPKDEGFVLAPNSWWERRYTGDQIKPDNPHRLFTPQWFDWEEINQLKPEQTKFEPWGQRIQAEHDSALLTTPDKRKPQAAPISGEQDQPQPTELTEELLEKIEDAKSKLLAQLKEIQEQINENLETVENQERQQPTASQNQARANLAQLKAQKKQFQQKISQAKSQLTRQQNKQQATQKVITQLKSAISKETKKLTQTERKLAQNTNQQQHQTLQTAQQTSQQKLAQLQQQLSHQQTQLSQKQQQTQSFESQTQTLITQIKQTQQQIQAAQPESIPTLQEQVLEEEWEEIHSLQEEVLEDAPAAELPSVSKALEAAAQAVEAAADSAEESAAAQQQTMTLFMLYLIIFLLEYIVYKRNGLPGLVILNVILAIAYYHKESLMEYIELWDKYVLIIGYVMGNVLAYSAPEQEKYKWPSVVGFNAIIALIYAYTWYQKRQIAQTAEKQIEKIHEKTIQTIQEQNQTYEKESQKTKQEYAQSQQKLLKKIDQHQKPYQAQKSLENELEQANQELQTIEDTNQKEQAQEKIQQITQTLQEIKKTSLTSTINIDLLEAKEPGIKFEWQRIKNWLKSISSQPPMKTTLSRLAELIEPLPLSKEDTELLANLHLTDEQVFAISSRAERIKYHQTELQENYEKLTNSQQLKLLNAGLHSLGLKSLESKQTFSQIRQQIFQEEQNFDLTTQEKENILRLLITNLNLTPAQRQSLEEMGVEFFNASNWQVSEEQKNQLLSFGLNKLELSQEQKEKLTNLASERFKTFAFSEPQKTILQSLAPLTKEFKYSVQSLELVRSLSLKHTNLTFLVNEEIIPNLHTAFGEVKSPYLPLKIKFLSGEQKTLQTTAKIKAKAAHQAQIQAAKHSILDSLLEFARREENLNLNFTLDNWVKIRALTAGQRDILLTLGFKTIPKYHFFELLRFAVEKFTDQTWVDFLANHPELEANYQAYLDSLANQEITINQTIWEKFVSSQSKRERRILADLNLKELINEQVRKEIAGYQLVQDADQSANDWTNLDMGWLTDDNLEYILNHHQGIQQALIRQNQSAKNWKIRTDLANICHAFYKAKTKQEWDLAEFCQELEEDKHIYTVFPVRVSGNHWGLFILADQGNAYQVYYTSSGQGIASEIKQIQPLISQITDQKTANNIQILTGAKQKDGYNCGVYLIFYIQELLETGKLELTKTYTSQEIQAFRQAWSDKIGIKEWCQLDAFSEADLQGDQLPSNTSRYDGLLANLTQEEAEHQRKKQAREQARKKLEEQEFARRQANLSQKDRKLVEEQAKSQREKELASQESEKRRELQAARDRELMEQEQARLQARTEQIERNRKLSQQALETKQQEIALEEQRQKEQIKALEDQNKLEQERLQKQAELLEEETRQRLAAIALEDTEQRNRIQQETAQRRAYLEEEMLQERRRHERELAVKEQELQRKKAEQQAELTRMQQETALMTRQEQELKQQAQQMRVMAQRQEQIDRQRRANRMSLDLIHEQALDYVLGYYPLEDEFKEAIQTSTQWGYYGTGNERKYLSVKNWFGLGARIDISRFYGIAHGSKQRIINNDPNHYWTYWASRQLSVVISYVGSGFLSQEQLRQRIKDKIRDPNVFN